MRNIINSILEKYWDHRSKSISRNSFDLNEELIKFFNIGDVLYIKDEPNTWSSYLNRNCPFDVKFPYKLVIKKLSYDDDHVCISISEGLYGWSLTGLVKDKVIDYERSIFKYDRKKKLEKLKML